MNKKFTFLTFGALDDWTLLTVYQKNEESVYRGYLDDLVENQPRLLDVGHLWCVPEGGGAGQGVEEKKLLVDRETKIQGREKSVFINFSNREKINPAPEIERPESSLKMYDKGSFKNGRLYLLLA